MVGLPDVVTHAKLDDDRFGQFLVVGIEISGFPIDFGSCPYNTLARTVPECDCDCHSIHPLPGITEISFAWITLFAFSLFCYKFKITVIARLTRLKINQLTTIINNE